MSRGAIRAWFVVHKWSSLICTLFLLMLCITGLPLVFHAEIDELTGRAPAGGLVGRGSSGTGPGLKPLDLMLGRALAKRPGEVPLFMAFDNDRPLMTITTGTRPDARAAEMTIQMFDRSTGKSAGKENDGGITDFLLRLHKDMFLGLLT